jgi:hypothetical protein
MDIQPVNRHTLFMNKKDSGISTAVGLITLIAVLLVIVIGWRLMRSNEASKTQSSTTTYTSTRIPVTDNSKTDSSKLVAEFYDKYSNSKPGTQANESIVKQYGTANLLAFYKDHENNGIDRIICAQIAPKSITISSGQDSTTLNVSEDFTNIPSQTLPVKIINDQTAVKIDSIDCNIPEPPVHDQQPL